jgi:diguanylate cyclase (GGDEF)-like protein
VRGALTLYRSADDEFTSEDGRLMSAIAPQLAAAILNGLKFRKVRDQAGADPLTGLPNAGALAARMAELDGPCAVVVCDLDGFKRVNDQFGHLTGNRVLEALADGFRNSCRGRDFVARIGGDEFVLLLDGIRPEEVGSRLDQFRQMVRATGRAICGDEVVDASLGTAFHPADGATPDELLAHADRQMYRRKTEQRTGVVRFNRRRRTGTTP